MPIGQAIGMSALDLKVHLRSRSRWKKPSRSLMRLGPALGEALERIEPLEEQLRTDSSNSSKTLSSDSPRSRAQRRNRPRSSRAQGAQPGHEKHARALVPESEVDAVERFFPAECDLLAGAGGAPGRAGGAPSGF